MQTDDTRTRRLWTAAFFLFVFVDGLGFQLRGALLPSLHRTFDVSPALLGLVATAGSAGFLVTVVVTGFLAGRTDADRLVTVAIGVVAVAIALAGFAPFFPVYLCALLVRGVATGPVRALDRPVLAGIYSGTSARIFNYYALAWAVGATVGPLVANAALAAGNWRYAYWALGAALVPVVLLVARLDLPEAGGIGRSYDRSDLRALARSPAVVGMAAAIVLSGGVEGALFTWLPYFGTALFSPATANLLLVVFLAAYVPARFLYGKIVDHVPPLRLLFVLATAALPVLLFTTIVATGRWVFVGAFVLGFLVSGLFPTMSAVGMDAAPEYGGAVNAVSTAASYTGISLVPPVIGLLTGAIGVAPALATLAVPLVGFVGVAWATARGV